MTIWRMRRIPMFEAAILAWTEYVQRLHDQNENQDPFAIGVFSPQARFYSKPAADEDADQRSLGRVLQTLLNGADELGKISRYEAQLSKQLYNLLELIKKVQKERKRAEQRPAKIET